MKKTVVILTALLVAACQTPHGVGAKSRKPFSVNGHEKRLNLADCNDLDDWYLDGFGVGKSHAAYKNKMLQQRISYCGEPSQNLVQAWESGFKQGAATVQKKVRKGKRSKRAN